MRCGLALTIATLTTLFPLIASTRAENVIVSNLAGLEYEVSIATNPTNPSNLVAIGHAPNGVITGANPQLNYLEINTFHSVDGGRNWTRQSIGSNPAHTLAPNFVDGLGVVGRTDPTVTFDDNGRLYVAYGDASTFMNVCRRGANAQRFEGCARVPGANGSDKWLLAAGPDPLTAGRQNVYLAFRNGSGRIAVSRSIDGGQTFNAPVVVSDSGNGGTFPSPAVDSEGRLYVVWYNWGTNVFVDWSADGGQTFHADVVATRVESGLHGTKIPAVPRGTVDRGIFAGPVLAVDRSGGEHDGRVYLTYVNRRDRSPSAAIPFDYDVYVRHADFGADPAHPNEPGPWSAPVRVSDDATTHTVSHFLPWISVDRSTGFVAVVWYDARDDVNNSAVRVYLGISTNGGENFDRVPNQRVSDCQSDVGTDNASSDLGGNRYFDYREYIGVSVDGCFANVIWTDYSLEGYVNGVASCAQPPSSMRDSSYVFARLNACPQTGRQLYWVGGSGAWNASNNWAFTEGGAGGVGQPLGQSLAYLTQLDDMDRLVTYQSTVNPAPLINRLTIDATGTGRMTLSQPDDELHVVLATLGLRGHGNVDQRGGVTQIQNLILASDLGSDGAWRLDNDGELQTQAEVIGFQGTGTFTQAGGSHTLVRQLMLGFAPQGSGTYTLSAGTLSANEELIGVAGTGHFTQSGGENRVLAQTPTHGGVGGTLTIARELNSHGKYTLEGGVLDASRIVNNDTFKFTGGRLFAQFTNNRMLRTEGSRTLEGKLVQGASGRLRLTIATPGTDGLAVTGDASLAGVVEVVLTGSVAPGIGESFDVLSARSISGFRVGMMKLPRIAGNALLQASLAEGATRIRVSVVTADLDGNGTVGCSDLAIVRSSLGRKLGETGYDARADINGDGIVDVRDLAAVAQKLPTGTRC